MVVDTYQAVAGTGHKAIVELEEQVKAHAEGREKVASVYPHVIGFNALPHIDVFLDNGYTKEEWKVVTESRKILHLPDLRVSCTAVRVPVFVSHSEAVHVETRDPITRGPRPRAVRGRPGRRGPGRPGEQPLPARDGRRRVGPGVRGPGAPGPVDPGQPRARLLGRRRTTCARVRRPTPWRSRRCSWSAAGSARAASARPRRRPGDRPRDPRRAPRGARADRERGPRLHPLPAARGPHARRPGRGRPRHGGRVRGRGPGLQRGPRGPPVRRPGRRAARAAAGLHRLAARGRVHHQRREVPPARQPGPAARRDRGLRPVPAPPAGGAGSRRSSSPWAATRWARSCPGPASARCTAPASRPIPRPAPATRWCSRCTTRPPPSGSPAIERESFEDMASVPSVLLRARERRASAPATATGPRPRPDPPQPRHPAGPAGDADTHRTRCVPAHGRRSRGRRRPPAHPVLTPKQIETTMADPNIPLRIIPLGGVGEIGKNCYVFEYGDDIVVIDCGLMFPDEEMFGIDLVVPDVTYLKENRAQGPGVPDHPRPRGPRRRPAVRAAGVPGRPGLRQHPGARPAGQQDQGAQAPQQPADRAWSPATSWRSGRSRRCRSGSATPSRTRWASPCARRSASSSTPATSSSTTPRWTGKLSDFHILARLGEEGVICLLSDSTRAENPGYTPSERIVGEAFREIMEPLDGRVIVATFASNIARLQQVLDAAADMKRKVDRHRPVHGAELPDRHGPRLPQVRRRPASSPRTRSRTRRPTS